MKPDYEIDRIINMELYCNNELIGSRDAKDLYVEEEEEE
jgi:hypothetical protein